MTIVTMGLGVTSFEEVVQSMHDLMAMIYLKSRKYEKVRQL